jgi:hypothetical protein
MNADEPAATVQPYRTLRVTKTDEGVLSVVIDAPPMNLIGPELVHDLVGLLAEVESGQQENAIFGQTSLSEHARLFRVDLPGFGASERREDLLSPRATGEFLAKLVAEADLGAPHIVAPDVGTAAAARGEADG